MLSQNPIYIKSNVSFHEYSIYKYINELNLSFIPKLIDWSENTLKIQRIPNMSISDMYGERIEDVPERIITEIRNIIKILYDNGIIYPDITGYNFIEDNDGKIWIIDFEHSFYNDFTTSYSAEKDEHIKFVKKFMNGTKKWNPWFT